MLMSFVIVEQKASSKSTVLLYEAIKSTKVGNITVIFKDYCVFFPKTLS